MSRHEILRTTFPRQVGVRGRSQLINDGLDPEWTEAAGELGTLCEREAGRPFDLDRGPLVRALLSRCDGEPPVLVLTAHGACADLRSLQMLAQTMLDAGGASDDDPVQYADYAEWRYELISGEDEHATDGRNYWKRQSEAPASRPRLLFGAPQAGSQVSPSAIASLELDAAEARQLQQAAATHGAGVSEFLEATWHALLARLTGVEDVLVAGFCPGREQPDLAQALGPFAQPVPIRSHTDPETSFAEVLDQVRRGRRDGSQWQDYATAAQQQMLEERAAAGFGVLEGSAGALRHARPGGGVALLAHGRPGTSGLALDLWYDPAIHPAADAEELVGRWRVLTLSAAADPARAVADLPLTEERERAALVATAAGPAPAQDALTPVHRRFEQRAGVAPASPAVSGAGRELTYSELDAAANRIAHRLRQAGVQRGSRVALLLPRTPRLLEALLGILKAGAAYVPLNHEHPASRLAHQLQEGEVRVLLSEEPLRERVPAFGGEVICLDREEPRLAEQPATDPGVQVTADDLAYVMYTSGSTGLPKGVAVTHGNLANYASDLAARLGGDGLFGVVSAISTDLGNTCIFPALTSGGCVALIGPEAAMDARAIAAELGDRRLHALKITPTHLRSLLAGDDGAAVLPTGTLVVGGEALSWELVARIRELAPECRILNHYGPTETTVGCCAYEVGAVRDDCATVPIGRPLAGVRAHVLDRALTALPVGVPGELCIAGAGVAAGYVGSGADGGPFLADPFEGGRMYRTGDRVRVLRDGTIEFLGRVDDQVKIRGFRIEPGEIEAALARHPAVRQAAVVAERDDRDEARLVAYLATGEDPSVEELQTFLAQSLPDYMIPSAFATLAALPLTPSGKVDRRALPDLAAAQTRRGAAFVAPRDELEREIASIWSELLGVEAVGVFDDFFALGGHSLMATQAIMRIRRSHGNVPLRALLAAPTVAALAEAVRGRALESA